MKNKDVEIIEVANGFILQQRDCAHRMRVDREETFVFHDEKELATFIRKEFKREDG